MSKQKKKTRKSNNRSNRYSPNHRHTCACSDAVWRIVHWQRIYESDPRGKYRSSSKFPMQYIRLWVNDDKHGKVYRAEVDGQRRACVAVGGYELLGVMTQLLTMAGDKPSQGLRGYLTDFRGMPHTAATIAREMAVETPKVLKWLAMLSSPQVAFLERVELSEMQRGMACLEAGTEPAMKESATNRSMAASKGGAATPHYGSNSRQQQDPAASAEQLGHPPPVGRSDCDLAANLEKSSTFFGENSKKAATVAVNPSKEKDVSLTANSKKKEKGAGSTASVRTALTGLEKNGIARDGYSVTESVGKGIDALGEAKVQGEGPQLPEAISPAVAAGAAAPDPGRTDTAGGPVSTADVSGHIPSPCRPQMRNPDVWARLRQTEPMATWAELWADLSRRKLAWIFVRALGLDTLSAREQHRNLVAICNAWLNAMKLHEWTEAEQLELFEKALQKAWALRAQQLEAAKGMRQAINPPKVFMAWWKQSTTKAAIEMVSPHT